MSGCRSRPRSPGISLARHRCSARWAPARSAGRLVFHVRRAGGAQGPEAARRLFRRLDEQPHLVRCSSSVTCVARTLRRRRSRGCRSDRGLLGRGARAAAAGLDRPALRAGGRARATTSTAAPCSARRSTRRATGAARRSCSAPGRSGYGVSTTDGSPLLRASRRSRASRASHGCCVLCPIPTTWTPRGPCGSWAGRCFRTRVRPRP